MIIFTFSKHITVRQVLSYVFCGIGHRGPVTETSLKAGRMPSGVTIKELILALRILSFCCSHKELQCFSELDLTNY